MPLHYRCVVNASRMYIKCKRKVQALPVAQLIYDGLRYLFITRGEVQVTKRNQDALGDKLDALSARIETRLREIKQRGAFSGIRQSGMDEIRKRSAAIKEKLDAAIANGSRWGILKYELERDFHSLNEDFARFENRLDAATMKQSGKVGVA
jgi:hypothetical protein